MDEALAAASHPIVDRHPAVPEPVQEHNSLSNEAHVIRTQKSVPHSQAAVLLAARGMQAVLSAVAGPQLLRKESMPGPMEQGGWWDEDLIEDARAWPGSNGAGPLNAQHAGGGRGPAGSATQCCQQQHRRCTAEDHTDPQHPSFPDMTKTVTDIRWHDASGVVPAQLRPIISDSEEEWDQESDALEPQLTQRLAPD